MDPIRPKQIAILIASAVGLGAILAGYRVLPGVTTLLWEGAFLGLGWLLWSTTIRRNIQNPTESTVSRFGLAFAAFWLMLLLIVNGPFWALMNDRFGYSSADDCYAEWGKHGANTDCE